MRSQRAPAVERLGLAFAAALILAIPGAAAGPEIPFLAPGPAAEHTIGAEEIHRYRLALTAGELTRVLVEQRGVDVVITLRRPNGAELLAADTPVGTIGPEPVSWLAEETGEAWLELAPVDGGGASSSYTIRLDAQRPPTDADRERLAGERAIGRGQQLRASGKAEDSRAALAAFEEARGHFRALGDRWWESLAIGVTGSLQSALSKPREALDLHEQALALRLALGEPRYEADSRANLGMVLINLNRWDEAREQLERALPLWRAAGDRRGEATSLNSLGTRASQMGDAEKAMGFYDKALVLRRELGDRRGLAATLTNMGAVYRTLGEFQQALAVYREALEIRRSLSDRPGERSVIHNLAALYSTLGENALAEESFRTSLALARESGDRLAEASSLHGLAILCERTGRAEEARASFETAVVLWRELGNRRGEAFSLATLGSLEAGLGRPEPALRLLGRSLELHRALADRAGEAESQNRIGVVRLRTGDPEGALAALGEALPLAQAAGARALEAEILFRMARAEMDRGRLDDARARIEAALAILESHRFSLASPDLRASFRAARREPYELHVEILMRLHAGQPDKGWDAAALEASERARARALFEMLEAGLIEPRSPAGPEQAERRAELRREIRALERRRLALLGGKAPEAGALPAVDGEIERLLAEHRDLEGLALSGVTRPEPLTVAAMRELLDPGTRLVEIALGEERSHAWVLSRDALHVRELPGRETIEEAARRLYELLTSPDRRAVRRQTELATAELSRLLLAPLDGLLSGERIVLVLDGALQYVPFGALPDPKTGEPLLARFEIAALPSLSVLPALRRNEAGHATAARNGLQVAILADPVFRADDPRVRGGATAAVGNGGDATRSAEESGLGSFERLAFSRKEAEAILGLAPQGAGLAALDFQADRDAASGRQVADARIVHFATHALLNNRHPELSGIVLSLVDEKGRERDGFLRLQDLYSMDLSAGLVVLSACRTALGREVRGEGLMGLTRGFMHAGAPRVVASLWDVRDAATAELMARFYRGLLQDKLPAAAALRRAQLSLAGEKRWESPYFWAGFVLQGDWR